MAERIAACLRALGADVALARLAPGRPSVVGVFEPAGRARATVLFAPHLDTVGVGGMTVPPFRLTARGGRLYGRGACDTKGPTAALLWALRGWSRRPAAARGRVRWIVAATAAEEPGSLGAQDLLDKRWIGPAGSRAVHPVDFAVALEPTGLRVVHAAKGLLRLWVETRGRAAHGSRPESGDNAVYRMLPLAAALRDRVAPALASRRHPVLGGASLNLGVIAGGQGMNLVPDRCRIGLDIRVHPGLPADEARRRVADACAEHAPGAALSVQRTGPSFLTGRREAWARRLRRVARGWAAVDWFSDANVFGAAGIPAAAFGPGSIDQAHAADEYIRRRELEAGAAALLRFLQENA
jgi:succinyl-diaminopimelate desuccinylase